MLMVSRNLEGALDILEEGTVIHFDSRELFFKKAEVHRALGNWREAYWAEVHAMDILYRTKSQLTDDQRITKIDRLEEYAKQQRNQPAPP